MCCKQPYWVEDETCAICRNCGANKPLNRPVYQPFIGPTIIPPTWAPFTNPYPATCGTGQSIGKETSGYLQVIADTNIAGVHYHNSF